MIAARLAEFARTEDIPAQALAVMRLSLLDWCAVGIAGQSEPVSRLIRAQALEDGGAPHAALIGSSTRVPARAAALVNGTISHALDYDDTHFAHIGHPSVAVIPAALACAEHAGASGRAFQEAALIGAEASIRVGVWLGRRHYQAGFHQTATAGAFGACLAACRLLGLTPDQMQMALGLASTRASGLKSQFGTMGKPMNAGIAAANGVEAAQLAQRGFVSRAEALDGPQGFGPTHAGVADDTAWDGMGQVWRFEEVSHKFHACCHGLHAMLEALEPLVGEASSDIERITINTHPRWLSVCNIDAPQTGLEAKFSYRQAAAMRLLGHDTGLPQSFTDAITQDPALRALRDKVTVNGTDTLSEMQAEVTVQMGDGPQQTLSHDLNARLPLAERRDRIRAKAVSLVGKERAAHLWALIEAEAAPADIAADLARDTGAS